MPVCINKLIIIGSDYGLSPGRHQAITWTNAGIHLILALETKFSEILRDLKIWKCLLQNEGNFASASMC